MPQNVITIIRVMYTAVRNAVIAPTTHSSLLTAVDGRLNAGALQVFQRISSFEKKPAKIGTPEIASQPVTMVAKVMGMYFLRPPMRRMSCS